MIAFTLNGKSIRVAAPPDRSLTLILRDDLGQTGTKIGCAIGRCGACMVLMDGRAVNACLIHGWQVAGRSIITIDGIATLPEAAAVQAGLLAENAFQCGYCAPGIVIVLAALFRDMPDAGDAAIRAALDGNLCRCTGYASILRGAQAARALLKA